MWNWFRSKQKENNNNTGRFHGELQKDQPCSSNFVGKKKTVVDAAPSDPKLTVTAIKWKRICVQIAHVCIP